MSNSRTPQLSSCGTGFVCDIRGRASRQIVAWGIEAVKNLTHRGAVGADGKTGDGAGILTEIPRAFFEKHIAERRLPLSHIDNLAIGSFFLYGNVEAAVEAAVRAHGLAPLGWRDVPTDDDALGEAALVSKPRIRQLLIDAAAVPAEEREWRLFLARKAVEKRHGSDVCILNLSGRTLLYKGLLVAPQLDRFFPDLLSDDFASSFCIFHQRFSTNTLPEWVMAQPFRVLAHNGEINTIQGNRNHLRAVEGELLRSLPRDEAEIIAPVATGLESDSASLDRVMELLILAGYSPEHAINLCIPPAWEQASYPDEVKEFLHYMTLQMAPWDGPAAVVFTDGATIGAHLDRNGLRPLRYVLTCDGIMVMGSEAGMVDLGTREIMKKGRLGPGDTLAIDLGSGVIRETAEILSGLAARRLYGAWLAGGLAVHEQSSPAEPTIPPDMLRRQIAFGYTQEEIETALKTLAATGSELTFSMGDDTPLPPLADKPPLLFRYFKQRFSQVTNPSIDPIREKVVMSLSMYLGPRASFLQEGPKRARRLRIPTPVLQEADVAALEAGGAFKVVRLDITYEATVADLGAALGDLTGRLVRAVQSGAEVILLSDRAIGPDRPAIPSLLAVSACYQALMKQGCGHCASLVIETGEARDVHHMACLIGFGASAVCPSLAFATISDLCRRGIIAKPFVAAAANFRKGLEDGLLKVLARLGISTLDAYHGAQLFDILCLKRSVVREYFGDVSCSIEADGLPELEASLLARHSTAYAAAEPEIDPGGYLKYRKGGEGHAWASPTVAALNRFVMKSDGVGYRGFASAAEGRPIYMRHLLGYRKGSPLPIEVVEPEEAILARFVSGAMSVGALSPEAHECIAEACNRLGMRSNSGEGGEDPGRYGTVRNSAIKQIASGRFGVTPGYLASAREIEIKMAQGAKPGEGGHLPSAKVTDYIARLRFCKPGTLLISPPPHHDIYSIEDLNQLIHDLKQANPEARVCVKLVSEVGVGTVAAGVAKAYADIVQISGYEGGTGASPITSIKSVGNYWEIGLSETQRLLMENGLRDRITVRVDGGLRTGRDVVLAALMGAEEFGFGTATMIAAGCVMARQCHLNTCPTGVATQDERLRTKFRGTPEGVMAYFRAVAQEVRVILAEMGFAGMSDIIGRTDLVTLEPDDEFPGSRRMRVEELLQPLPEGRPLKGAGARNDNPSLSLADRVTADIVPFIERGEKIEREYSIRNVDRSVPVRLNYHMARSHGEEGLPDGTITLRFQGTAGQSFGAFNHKGLTLMLTGEANDYVGKGMHGGVIAIRPDPGLPDGQRQVIVGNTVLYGATGGSFFAAGMAGERFAVRNSGAVAVVEGAGQHCGEYMTRGEVVVLGPVGHNVGAGMTGGVLYLHDGDGETEGRINAAYVRIVSLDSEDRERLKSLIGSHHRYTGSPLAAHLLAEPSALAGLFKKIVPL